MNAKRALAAARDSKDKALSGKKAISKSVDDADKLEVDHDLYVKFWGFQKYFVAENKSIDSKEKWEKLVHDVSTVLSAFENFR